MEPDQIFAHPARVIYQQEPGDTDRWMGIVRQLRAADPTIFDERAPFFWPAEISSTRLDAYFTRMDAATTLRNFVADANAGVAFQNSHRWMELPLGQSVEATMADGEAGDRAIAVFYTVPGLRLNGVDTTDFINSVRAGIVSDVSVGFYGGKFICNICGRDMLSDWECIHVPGLTYQVKESDSDVRAPVLCTATVVDARLSEVSAVYDGATPGAGVLKAQREAGAGRLSQQQMDILEARYRVRLFERTYGGIQVPTEDETREVPAAVPDATRVKVLEDAHAILARAIEDARGVLLGAGAHDDTMVEMAAWAVREINALRPLAEDGRRYRADLIEEALAEGVRGMGTTFDIALYRALLDSAETAQVKRLRDQWRSMGDAKFAGGPVTRETNDKPASTEPAIAKRAYE